MVHGSDEGVVDVHDGLRDGAVEPGDGLADSEVVDAVELAHRRFALGRDSPQKLVCRPRHVPLERVLKRDPLVVHRVQEVFALLVDQLRSAPKKCVQRLHRLDPVQDVEVGGDAG